MCRWNSIFYSLYAQVPWNFLYACYEKKNNKKKVHDEM